MVAPSARILVVDDDPAGRYSKSRILRFAGFNVFEAGDGAQAVEQIVILCPDLVLLDVNLPDISGFEVCRRIRNDKLCSRTPIILTSAAFTKGADRARGLEGGADNYIIEPIEPEVLIATVQNLLRTKRAEELVRLASLQWSATFEAITDGIALIDTEGRVICHNFAFQNILNLKGSGAIENVAVGELLLPQLVDPNSFRSEQGNWTLKTSEFQSNSGWLRISAHPVTSETGDQNGNVLVVADISEQKQAEQDLERAIAAAEHANAAKDQFLAILSHELRTPLTPVLAILELLRTEESLPASLKDHIDMLWRNVNLEASLIDDLLDLTRIVKGKVELNIERIDVHNLIKNVEGICQEDVSKKRLHLAREFNASNSFVLGDAARLSQILWNLIKNAVKFTSEGGEICVRTCNEAEDTITIEVQDSGIGISQEVLSRIFNPFEQGDKSITRRFGGLGLGLTISKKVAELHSGDLTATSDGHEKGSLFSLILPLA